MKIKKAVIIGGGLLGMSAAYEFCKKNISVQVIEKDPILGGLAASKPFDGVLVDKFYHFYYWNDFSDAKKLFKDVDIDFQVEWKNINTLTFTADEKFVNFDSIFQVMKIAKTDFLKVLVAFLKLKFFPVSEKLDTVSAVEWCEKAFGHHFAKNVWWPLLIDKFSDDYNKISAYFFATRIKRHLSTKVGLLPRSRFGYLKDTYKPVTDKISKMISSGGGKVHLGEKVLSLDVKQQKISAINLKEKKIEIDDETVVVSTVPLADLAKINVDGQVLSSLKSMKNVATVVVILSLTKKLSDNYWTTISNSNIPFAVIIQQNRLYEKSKNEIVYLSRYLESSSEFFSMTNEEIYKHFINALKVMYPKLSEDDVVDYDVNRSSAAAPIPYVDSLQMIPPFKNDSFENFWHAGYEHVFPEDRGVSNSIRIGRELAEQVIDKTI